MANNIDYFEIGTPDPAGSKVFYEGLFGWVIEPPTGPAPYSMVDEGRGGMWNTSGMGEQSWAIFYVNVEDVAAAVSRATDLGATVAFPLTDNGTIEFAHLIDPLGNRFAVWHPKPA